MAEKKDFMSELAKSVDAKKRGEQGTIHGVDEFTPKRKPQPTITQQINEAETTKPVEVKQPEVIEPVVEPVRKETEAEIPVFSMPEVEEPQSTAPDSFQEEVRVKVDKPKRQMKPITKVLLGASVALVAFLIYWFGFRANIVVPDFVGQNVSQVSTWARQVDMNSGVVAMAPREYSMEYDEDIVIAQSVDAGDRVRKNTPITITVSAGPDPDELITFPDIRSMTADEIREWVDENKLLKTRITTSFSDTVPDGEVISYELRNVDEDEFTRGSTLNIVTSKGVRPEEAITVTDFVGKTYSEAESWANRNGIVINKVESYSSDVAVGYVISQDKRASESIRKGDTMTVVVSKGAGVTIPNLVGYSSEQLDAWRAGKDSNVTLITRSVYNSALEGTVIAQSIPAGSVVDGGEVLELTISLYLPIVEKTTTEWIGANYLTLKAWVDEVNGKGASIQAGEYGADFQPVYSDSIPKDGIVKIACYYGTSELADGCGRPLNLNSRIAYQISLGPEPSVEPTPEPTPVVIEMTSNNITDFAAVKSFVESAGGKLNYVYDAGIADTDAVTVSTSAGTFTSGQQFSTVTLEEGSTITVSKAE